MKNAKEYDRVLLEIDYGVELTLRELIVSVGILLIMIVLGIYISNRIKEQSDESNTKYEHAVQIQNDTDQFNYVVSTNVPNAFIYGDYEAVGSVSYDEISGDYLYVHYDKEKYTEHTRQVEHR